MRVGHFESVIVMKSFRLSSPRLLWALLFCVAGGFPAQAQSWPTRPITIVISFGAGGAGDLIARPFAEYASRELGQPVIIENRPGGGGIIGAIGVAKAAPDGYTLLVQASGPMILRPILDPAVGFNALKDFSPIVLFGGYPNVVLAGAQFAPRTMKETIVWAKQNPGRLTIGHPGLGTVGHLAGVLLANKAGITANFIAYRDNLQMMPDLLGGRIDIGVVAYTAQLKAARVMAVMSPDPVEFLPGVPTMRDAGLAGVYASTWFALFGPANLPPEIVAKINAVANAFLNSDDGRKRMALIGLQTVGGSAKQLAAKMAEDTILWSKVIKDANIKLDGKH
jgi:tripartite-type tricarboxylate transporter receptor subunit TctC